MIRKVTYSLLLTLVLLACQSQPTPRISATVLSISVGLKDVAFSSDDLWNHPKARDEWIDFPDYYNKRRLRVRVIPLEQILVDALGQGEAKSSPGLELSLRSLDGFAAPLASELIFHRKLKSNGHQLATTGQRPEALIAIEPDATRPHEFDRWPVLQNGPGRGATAGPIALVWKNASLRQVGPEQWPYQVVSISVVESIERRYPLTAPKKSASGQVINGYKVFQKNCIACHSLNVQGGAQIGPDLNWPQSPVDYFNLTSLRKYIRNPKNLRHWDNSSMPGFNQEVIPDSELDALIAYFSHMASTRPKQLPKTLPDSKQR